MKWLVLAVVVGGAFLAVVAPLFQNGGPISADVTGFFPGQVTAGRPFTGDIGVDNTGDAIISPLCLQIEGGSGVRLLSASFQGLDTVAAVGNRVCGGALTGQETISVTLSIVAAAPGTTVISVVPAQGAQRIGRGYSQPVQVSP